MAGKKNTEDSNSWVGEIEKYSRQIWLAGLGAYSKISKDGNKLFEGLVEDGEQAETHLKKSVDKQLGGAKASAKTAKSKVESVRGLARGKWNELEEAFDKRLNSAISRLGVPSRLEVRELNAKVEELTAKLEALTGVSAASVKPVAKSAVKPAPKPAAKVAAKTPAKPASKPASKAAAAKAPSKAAVKTAAKAAPVAAAKPAARKPAAKKPALKVAPAQEAVTAPVATPVAAPAAQDTTGTEPTKAV